MTRARPRGLPCGAQIHEVTGFVSPWVFRRFGEASGLMTTEAFRRFGLPDEVFD